MKGQKTMHCWSCGKKMTAVVGNYEYDDKCLGHLSVPCKAKPTALRRLRAFGELLREFMPLRSAAMFTF